MGDPLSVAASIAGLVTLSAQLYTIIDNFVSNVKDAPAFARTISSELNAFHGCISSLQVLLTNTVTINPQRGELLSARHIITTLADAVLLLGDMQKVLFDLTGAAVADMSLVVRAYWMKKKPKLLELEDRLHRCTSMLTLQVMILRCSSDADARRSQEVLDGKVDQLLALNHALESRMMGMDRQLRSIHGGVVPDDLSVHSAASEQTTIPATGPPIAPTETIQPAADVRQSREFETLLLESWVYRRTAHYDEDQSVYGLSIRTGAVSILSQITMTAVSTIAVMKLPVAYTELCGPLRDSTICTTSTSSIAGQLRPDLGVSLISIPIPSYQLGWPSQETNDIKLSRLLQTTTILRDSPNS